MSDVLVIGGANVDVKAKTSAAHIPRTSNPGAVTIKAGGVARNIAHNLAKLNIETTLLSVIGNDTFGEMLIKETQKAGVNTSHMIRTNQAMGSYIAVLDEKGELITAVSDMGLLSLLTQETIIKNKDLIMANKHIISDCNLSEETLNEIASLCADRLIIEPVSVAKSQKLLNLLANHNIYLATPNLDQIEALTGSREIPVATKALHKMGLQNIVIHAGEQGAYVSDGKEITHIPSQAKIVVDVTGAGDAATAGLISGLIKNLPLAKAAEIGQIMAAKVIASHSSTLD
jgi:pseudouridine kinase